MPGRNEQSWPKKWIASETRVIRVPAYLVDELVRIAHAIEDGARIEVIPQPGLFDKPKSKKRNKPVTEEVPHGTQPESKPVTSKRKPKVSPKPSIDPISQ